MANDLVPQKTRALGTLNTAEMDELVWSYIGDMERQGQHWTLSVLPSAAERAAFEKRGRDLDVLLRPISMAVAERDRAVTLVAELFMGFPMFKPENPREVVATYVAKLMDFPIEAVRLAFDDISNGRVWDLKPDFPPTVPRVVQLVEAHAKQIGANRQAVRVVLEITHLRVEPPSNDEMAKKVSGLLQGLSATMKARNDQNEADERAAAAARSEAAHQAAEKFTLDKYAALGMEPRRDPNGNLISPSRLPIEELTK